MQVSDALMMPMPLAGRLLREQKQTYSKHFDHIITDCDKIAFN